MIDHIDFFFIILFSFNVIVRTDERTDGQPRGGTLIFSA